jgi:hypothetical protein
MGSTGLPSTAPPMHRVTTVYSRIGDGFAYLCVLGLILLMGQALLRREQPAAAAQHQPV